MKATSSWHVMAVLEFHWENPELGWSTTPDFAGGVHQPVVEDERGGELLGSIAGCDIEYVL